MPSSRASASIALSSANAPSTWPGARNAVIAGVFTQAKRFHGAHVGTRVHLVEHARRPALPAADAERHVGLADDGGEPAVAPGA